MRCSILIKYSFLCSFLLLILVKFWIIISDWSESDDILSGFDIIQIQTSEAKYGRNIFSLFRFSILERKLRCHYHNSPCLFVFDENLILFSIQFRLEFQTFPFHFLSEILTQKTFLLWSRCNTCRLSFLWGF